MIGYYADDNEYGLEVIGDVQWGDACCEFDITAVWKKDGQFYIGHDSGRSCPAPFEYTNFEDLEGPFSAHKAANSLLERLDEFVDSKYTKDIEVDQAKQDVTGLITKIIF